MVNLPWQIIIIFLIFIALFYYSYSYLYHFIASSIETLSCIFILALNSRQSVLFYIYNIIYSNRTIPFIFTNSIQFYFWFVHFTFTFILLFVNYKFCNYYIS